MTKQQQFLYIVQSYIIIRRVEMLRDGDKFAQSQIETFASTMMGVLFDATHASERIPDDLNALEAASDFCEYFLDNADYNTKSGSNKKLPSWCARP